MVGVTLQELTVTCNVIDDITGKNNLVAKMDHYNKHQTKKYTHAHSSTLHTQHMAAMLMTTGRSSAATNSLHMKLYIWRFTKFYLLTLCEKWAVCDK